MPPSSENGGGLFNQFDLLLQATTLVHKGAMEIAQHSIRSFAKHFSQSHTLTIHADNTVGEQDQQLLLQAAKGMQANVMSSEERKRIITESLVDYPNVKILTDQNSYFTKLEIPMVQQTPFFYFDSDIIWLRHVRNLNPVHAPNAFSTETWTFYPGMTDVDYWIKSKVPRRINSGFFYVSEPFPFQKLEQLLAKGFYDSGAPHAGDQEIFAFLYPGMENYHPDDMKRSRVGSIYNLKEMSCAALHFCGGMWKPHLKQIEQLSDSKSDGVATVRFVPSVPMSGLELYRTNISLKIGDSKLLAKPLNVARWLLRRFR